MSAELAELNRLLAEFPPELVQRVLNYAISLKQPYWERPGYSSEWSDEDIQEAMHESMRQFDAQHPGEDWSHQPHTPGYK
jgi:hypothetical protein